MCVLTYSSIIFKDIKIKSKNNISQAYTLISILSILSHKLTTILPYYCPIKMSIIPLVYDAITYSIRKTKQSKKQKSYLLWPVTTFPFRSLEAALKLKICIVKFVKFDI